MRLYADLEGSTKFNGCFGSLDADADVQGRTMTSNVPTGTASKIDAVLVPEKPLKRCTSKVYFPVFTNLIFPAY